MAEVAIIGAGFVGLSAAYWLVRDGHRVTVYDPAGPAGGASFGNAGTFASYACIPVNNPSVFRDIHRYLFAAQSPFRVKLAYLPTALPWLARFLLHATPKRYEAAAGHLGRLLARAYDGYRDMIAEAGLEGFVRRRETLYLHSSEAALVRAEPAIRLRERLGVPLERLAPEAVAALEPNLAPLFAGGILFRNSFHLASPSGFLAALAAWLEGRGVEIRRERVDGIDLSRTTIRLATGTAAGGACDRLVVAAGAHSGPLARQCGDRLPLDTERGQHVTFPEAAHLVGRPVGWAERGLYMTPMTGGLRVAGTVELAGLRAARHPQLAELLAFSARRALPALGSPGETWLGFRPTLPDGLPVIGPASGDPRVVYAFGHQHIGLTLGGLTGLLVADLMAGRPSSVELAPFSARRFS